MSKKKYSLLYSFVVIGAIINIMYFAFEYIRYGPYLFEHFTSFLVEHLMILSVIPSFAVVSYLFKKEIDMQAELQKYTQELESSNKLKDLFIDILRHDLLNSVGIIKNTTELLEDDPSANAFSREVSMIKRNTGKLEEIINTAFKYAELANVEKFDIEKKDLAPIIKSAVESSTPIAAEKNITIENTVAGEYPVRVAPFIEEVFSNLISNAIKYSPENTKVTISTEDLGNKVKVGVKDQGEGIENEYKEIIFERFRVGGKKGIKGSGLGLAIVKRIINLHGGKVWVEDNPGGGSIFYFEVMKV